MTAASLAWLNWLLCLRLQINAVVQRIGSFTSQNKPTKVHELELVSQLHQSCSPLYLP
jgi:hypothetical protein